MSRRQAIRRTEKDANSKSPARSPSTWGAILLATSCLVAGCSTENVMGHGSFILAPSDLLTEISGEWLNIENRDEETLVVAPVSSFGFLDGNPTSLSKGGLAVGVPQTVPVQQGMEQLYILNGQLVRIEGDLQTQSSSAVSARP